MSNKKILFAASEVYPFAKTGGLADVVGALPKELVKLGFDVKVVMPLYGSARNALEKLKLKPVRVFDKLSVLVGWGVEYVDFYKVEMPGGVEVYFVDKPLFYDREGIYGIKYSDYVDNSVRFSLFCFAALAMVKNLNWHPHIIHCHDWQSGLIPYYLKTKFKKDSFYKDIKVLYTIHNLAYHGSFDSSHLTFLGINNEDFTFDKLEFHGRVNLKKAGLVYADLISTVSPTYAKEIQTKEYGCGLEGLLQFRKKDLHGILNGVDYDVWDPAKDPALDFKYSPAKLDGKIENKKQLKKMVGFTNRKDLPIVGIVSRLADQKGFDILRECSKDLMKLKFQVILLGTGQNSYHVLFEKLAKEYPDHIKVFLKYDAMLAEHIYAGSDMFLMPSHFEPCGLGQLISLKYGTVPIVNKTGGLSDTVREFDTKTKKGNGFVMKKYSAGELVSAVKRAINVYKNKDLWEVLMVNGMREDFSWKKSAKQYKRLYEKLI
ncbi:glycogen synthase GlgA [bacterium]|nr:glycogen synthase GlgA [bacterium]